eukprot:TRINITY_DN3040_c0_g2_i1.p1 TRINITY_DN3040_c0_g2~~TRINITY_DN3040_c0_g2_i1.p1  ORF type:complete len:354 (+),score=77.58 TRINITY_DN3040_c0_g2_i1:127-1188(+)
MAPKRVVSASKRKSVAGSTGSEPVHSKSDDFAGDFPPLGEASHAEDHWHKKPKARDRSISDDDAPEIGSERSRGSGVCSDDPPYCDELPKDQMARANLSEQNPEEVPEISLLNRSAEGITQASSDGHADRRILGAAAALGGAAGVILGGPLSGAALGISAAYATTREDNLGHVSRKAGGVYLQVQDRAIDEGIDLLDKAVDKGKRQLERQVENRQVPAPVRAGLRYMLDQKEPALRKDTQQANLEEARRMRQKYPDRVPLICERSAYAELPELPKKKFIIPGAMTCGEFKYIVHKQLQESPAQGQNLKAEQTIYIFVNGFAPKTSTPMSELYDQWRAEDGFLYIRYGAENTLG